MKPSEKKQRQLYKRELKKLAEQKVNVYLNRLKKSFMFWVAVLFVLNISQVIIILMLIRSRAQ
jgi:hypothetical protein